MDTLLSLKVFRQVVESSGFTAASLVLDMSVAMVSKHVQHLETQVGTLLLHRTSRRVSLTTAGSLYFDRCCELLNGLEEAESEVRCSLQRPRGTLRLSAPSWFADRFFARVLHGYRQRFPEVDLDVSLSDAFVDLVEDGLDLALRVTRNPDPRHQMRCIAPMHFVMVASRDYLDRRGRPTRVEDLAGHDLLQYAYADWTLPGLTDVRPGFRLNNTTLIGQLAAAGAGLAVLPRILVEQESYARDLEAVLPDLVMSPPSLYAVTHERRHLSIRVTSFIDFLVEHVSGGGCSGGL